MTILNKILAEKKKEVNRLKSSVIEKTNHKRVTPFSEIVKNATKMNVIAEIKRSSPSKGAIQMAIDPAAQAKRYEELGASAISVLTDTPFFNGTMDDLRAVRSVVDLPILCKDFIIDPIQIDQAKSAGANIILLIVAALNDVDLQELYNYAKNLNLEVIIEVHNEEEMDRALKLNPEIIGINNRDLKTFTVDLKTTERIASMVTNSDTILISESGLRDRSDVVEVANFGANVILVGETFMRATDLGTTFTDLLIPLEQKEMN